MVTQTARKASPDLRQGVPAASVEEGGILEGQVDGETVILARSGGELFAVGGVCTHYNGPLAEGIIVGETVRCPWHHACFSLRTGEALGAPAFSAIPCWKIEQRGDRIYVTGKKDAVPSVAGDVTTHPKSIVIVGGGAAGFAAAEMLRRRGFAGRVTMLSSDEDAPYDRPNLSKDYLAGTAPEEWIPLRSARFYETKQIDLHLATTVSRINAGSRSVITGDGRSFPFDRLLLATGAEPVRLPVPGADRSHVFVLRSLADSRAIVERAGQARSVVVIGAGFIGLETAAALRARALDVHVVAPDALPLQKVLGKELGRFIRSLHERHGVRFHLEDTAIRINPDSVTLASGDVLAADLVIVGIGVRPRTSLAEGAGIEVGNGIRVDAFLETGHPGIFAAGDVAEWQDGSGGERRRVEHWVVAERQGQIAALNMLGERQQYVEAPFFWSVHYDVAIRYVGHGAGWDAVEIDGDIAADDCLVRYQAGGRTIAVATIGRDRESLRAAATMDEDSARKAVSFRSQAVPSA